jgi:hypothetical protein
MRRRLGFVELCKGQEQLFQPSRPTSNEFFQSNPMRLKTVIFVAFAAVFPTHGIAGGTLSTSELHPLMEQMPAVRDFLRSSLHLSESAYAEVRLGPEFRNLTGARMGPYMIDAKTTKDGTPLVVVLCTSVQFLDSKGRKLPDARIIQATSIEEKLTGVMLRQQGDDTAQPPC